MRREGRGGWFAFSPPVFSVSLCFTEQMKSVQRSNLEDKFIDTPDKMEKDEEIERERRTS